MDDSEVFILGVAVGWGIALICYYVEKRHKKEWNIKD